MSPAQLCLLLSPLSMLRTGAAGLLPAALPDLARPGAGWRLGEEPPLPGMLMGSPDWVPPLLRTTAAYTGWGWGGVQARGGGGSGGGEAGLRLW